MQDQTSQRAQIENCIHRAVSEFLANEMEPIHEGADPKLPLEHYLHSAWNLSGLTADTLETVTRTGIQVWNRIQPKDETQADDLLMKTDGELSDAVSGAIVDAYNAPTDINSISTTHRAIGTIGKAVIGATAGLFLLASVAATNLSCTNYSPSTVTPAGVASVETAPGTQASPASQPAKGQAYKAGPGNQGGEGCLEMRLDMKFNSSGFTDKEALKKIEAFVVKAAEAGHTELYCTGLASIESGQDGNKPVNDDDDYNTKLSQKRAEDTAAIINSISDRLKKNITAYAGNFSETEALGKTDLAKKAKPRYQVNPANRTVVIGVRPIEDPDRYATVAAELNRHKAGEIYARACGMQTPDQIITPEAPQPPTTQPGEVTGEVEIGTPKITPAKQHEQKKLRAERKNTVHTHAAHRKKSRLHRQETTPPQTYDKPNDNRPIHTPGGGRIDIVKPGQQDDYGTGASQQRIKLPNGSTLDVIVRPNKQTDSAYNPPAQAPARTDGADSYKGLSTARKPAQKQETQDTHTYNNAQQRKHADRVRMPPADASTKAYERKMLRQYEQQQKAAQKAAAKAEKERKNAAAKAPATQPTPQAAPKKPEADSAEQYFKMLREHNQKTPAPKSTPLPKPMSQTEQQHISKVRSAFTTAETEANRYLKLSDIIAKECGEKGKGNTLCSMDQYKGMCYHGKPNVPKDTASLSACRQAKIHTTIGLEYALKEMTYLKSMINKGPDTQAQPATAQPETKKAAPQAAAKRETKLTASKPENKASPAAQSAQKPELKKTAQAPQPAKLQPSPLRGYEIDSMPPEKPAPSIAKPETKQPAYTPQPQKKAEAPKPAPAKPKPAVAKPAPKPPAITATLPTVPGNYKSSARLIELGNQIMRYVRLTNAVKAECESDGTKNTLCGKPFSYQCSGNDPRRAYEKARFSVCNKAWAEALVGYNIINGEYKNTTKDMQHADRNDPAMKKALEGYQRIIEQMNKVLMDIRISNKTEKTSMLEQRIHPDKTAPLCSQKDVVYYSWSGRKQESRTYN
ncbi:hypothetical protein KY363_01175 [Candidatus Woesearchaeota archaeon]|nr:hypothetical protein [Candidatus Woesearchaeota archaeon]